MIKLFLQKTQKSNKQTIHQTTENQNQNCVTLEIWVKDFKSTNIYKNFLVI